MGLFDWLRSKRPAPAPALPVRYGLGPPPPRKPPTPDDLCPLCGHEVAEVRWVAHWSYTDGMGGTLWRGRCSTCDTVLFRRFARDDSPAWRAAIPRPEQLQAAVSAEELGSLTTRFQRLDLFDRQWSELLAAQRPGDEVWRFVSEEGREGYAVVRKGRPLAQFLAPNPDHEQSFLKSTTSPADPPATTDPAT